MATPAGQARAQALNAKLEGEARVVIDEIDKIYMRKAARESLVCSIKCYDKAGKTGSSEALEMCASNCQLPHRQANAMVQQVCVFVILLNRAVPSFCVARSVVLITCAHSSPFHATGDWTVPESLESRHARMSGQGARPNETGL